MSSSGFCTQCNCRIETFEGLTRCPACGTTRIPCADKNQVTVSVNWHELRILVMWAERWATHIKDDGKSVYAIARRLENQHPDRAMDTPLTFVGELRQLKDSYNDMSIHKNTGEIDEPLTKQVEEYRGIFDANDTGEFDIETGQD